MLSIRRPSVEVIRRFLQEQAALPCTYSTVGATAHTPPAGFVVDQTRVLLGNGEEVFRAAKVALQNWQHFQLGWVEASPRETPIRAGEVVAVMGHALGVWWLNACRIVYVVDETEPVTRFGFAYGTLPGHVECGEERFQIEWHRSDQSVWYDILAFSRPHHLLARLGSPVVRKLQKRFAADSARAMRAAVADQRGCSSRRVAPSEQ